MPANVGNASARAAQRGWLLAIAAIGLRCSSGGRSAGRDHRGGRLGLWRSEALPPLRDHRHVISAPAERAGAARRGAGRVRSWRRLGIAVPAAWRPPSIAGWSLRTCRGNFSPELAGRRARHLRRRAERGHQVPSRRRGRSGTDGARSLANRGTRHVRARRGDVDRDGSHRGDLLSCVPAAEAGLVGHACQASPPRRCNRSARR